MSEEDIKNNMIPDEIKDICRSCESNIFAQNKGCAFRSLGNEYCDYVLEATKVYLDKQQELERYKNIIEIMERYFELIIDLSFDYDGLNEVKSLKVLIDELKNYASLGRTYNTTEPIYENNGKKYNILNEELKERNKIDE